MGGLETSLLRRYAAHERHTAVLVTAMSAGDGHAVPRWPEALGRAAEAAGGRVVRQGRGELVALFASAEAAAVAAARIHREAERALPGELGLHSAFHIGPVAQRGHDVLGDTVNLAAELASRARDGQVLTSHQTAAELAPEIRGAVRPVAIAGRGVAPLGELCWRDLSASDEPAARPPELRLTYRYNTLVRRREGDALAVGRDPDCELCVDLRLASRRHCTLERRGDKVFLRDHSTNGTFITQEGGREARIRAEEIVLHGRGWLSLGVSRLLAEELVEFRCE